MSKSYNNFISLSESNDSIRTKFARHDHDPARKLRTDPAIPTSPSLRLAQTILLARNTKWSAEAAAQPDRLHRFQKRDGDSLIKWIEPIRARREELRASRQSFAHNRQPLDKSARCSPENDVARP